MLRRSLHSLLSIGITLPLNRLENYTNIEVKKEEFIIIWKVHKADLDDLPYTLQFSRNDKDDQNCIENCVYSLRKLSQLCNSDYGIWETSIELLLHYTSTWSVNL